MIIFVYKDKDAKSRDRLVIFSRLLSIKQKPLCSLKAYTPQPYRGLDAIKIE